MTRHGYSSFNNKAARTIKDYGNQYNMANRSNSSLERIHQNHTTGNPIETPLRRKSKHSQSRSNSKSAHRLRLSQRPSSMTLSMTKSQKQLSEQNINRVVKKNEVRRTRNNALKKSLKSNGSSLSHHDRSERMNSRDLARTIKYQKNQKLNSNHFGIQDALYTMDPIPDLKGQITGKFRSFNEPILAKTAPVEHQGIRFQQVAEQDQRNVAAQQITKNMYLPTDDYCETLTASSDNSPVRPPQRVMRAVAKSYLNDVK